MAKPKATEAKSAFEAYRQGLSEADVHELSLFFTDVGQHVRLAKEENAKMRADFEHALLHYHTTGVPLDVALERLSPKNLGGFYARRAILWYALDDSAKIYPLSMRHGQMAVFRLSIYFKQPIAPALLQLALTFTIKRFPSFATTVKKGFFWHYLDTSKRRYAVEPEVDIPCRPLQISSSGSQSFRVVYHHNRVSIEYFHILTDAIGGMVFLKTLAAEYLRLCGFPLCVSEGILNINGIPTKSETANEFSRADKTEKSAGFVDSPAVQMSGALSRIKPCRVLHFKMQADRLKEAAAARGATVTAYLLALMLIAGKSATDERRGTMNILLPVNMRRFYPSDTVRNFAMYCGIKLAIDEVADVASTIDNVSQQLAQKASKRSMSEMMNTTERMARRLRYVPLFIKAPAARIGYGFLGDKFFSNTLSNLGVVSMPPQMVEQVDCMDFVLGTTVTKQTACALVTVGNVAMFSIAKTTVDPSFEETLFALLTEDGLAIAVEGSPQYES